MIEHACGDQSLLISDSVTTQGKNIVTMCGDTNCVSCFTIYIYVCVCVCAQSLSCVQLFCDSMNRSPPGSSAHGIFQARILELVVISSPGELPDPGTKLFSPSFAGGFFTTEPTGKPLLISTYTYI